MTLHHKLIWAEGIALSQQHFQQWDNFNIQLMNIWVDSITPYAWGLKELIFDEELLKLGHISIKKCIAIFSGRIFVHYDESENTHNPLSLNIKQNDEVNVSIYLALPMGASVQKIPGYSESSLLPTWRTDFQLIKDAYDEQRERELMFARPNLLLLTDKDNLDQFHIIKIMSVCKIHHDQYRINENYIPPILHIGVCAILRGYCQRLLLLLTQKMSYIKNHWLSIKISNNEVSYQTINHVLISQAIARTLPMLIFYYNCSVIHPEKLYCTLASMIGELLVLSKRQQVSDLPAYQHEQLFSVFQQLEFYIQNIMNEILISEDVPVVLHKKSPTRYETDSIDEMYFENYCFYLSIYFESTSISWVDQCIGQIKIGTQATINSIIALALPGLTMTHAQRLPQNFPIKTGHEYFYLEQHGEYWERIKLDKNIVIFLPDDFISAVVDLIVVKK